MKREEETSGGKKGKHHAIDAGLVRRNKEKTTKSSSN